MKKISAATVILLIVLFNLSNAEDDDSRDDITFGAKAGLNYSNVYDEQGENFIADPAIGIAFGGFVLIPIGTYIGIQPELLFAQRGFDAKGTLFGNTYGISRTTNYIDIPILFSFKPLEGISLLAGPQFSYLISQSTTYDNGITTVEQRTEFENDNYRKNTLCFTGGADISVSNIIIGIRAGWDLQNNNGDGTSATPKYKNTWYQLTAGIKL